MPAQRAFKAVTYGLANAFTASKTIRLNARGVFLQYEGNLLADCESGVRKELVIIVLIYWSG